MGREQKASCLYIITGVLIALVAISFARLSYGMVLPLMKDGLSISYKSAGFRYDYLVELFDYYNVYRSHIY